MSDRGQDPIQNLLYPVREGAIDHQGHVAEEVACRACGYNLKLLPASGRCPECGAPIAISAAGDWIQNSRPDWVWHVARWTEASARANLLMMCGLALSVFSYTWLAGVIGTALVLEFWAVAAWQSVEPEDSQDGITRAQLVTRIAAALVAALVAIGSIFAAAGMLRKEPLVMIIMGTWMAYIVASACQLRVLSQILFRAPNTELAWRLGMRWKYLALWHFACALCVVAEANGAATCCFGLIASIGAVCVMIGMSLLELRAAQMLKLEAKIGVENWRYHEQVSRKNGHF